MANPNDYVDDHFTAADWADEDLDTWSGVAAEEAEAREQEELEAFLAHEEELDRIFDNSRFNI